ncbi:CRISPR-associated protein [Caldanaerovirga acetigignens]|uniref:CRISPR-associated protein n=1 Tax=Caldanaerovirga acetigignens TaxID=447595 RepID=A0A1M7MMU4_9FIRM|nr:TIGR03986 family CRISPR-associated RAMP protein [Caldanaerovirga acetigignens]SHM92312.1 CRISPR-associated protein [Caldanaerovirga acetigignens]
MSKRVILNLPKHRNPEPNRTASAPYNFVPLPEIVVTAVNSADELPDHDRYHHNKYTGYFDVTLTTRSPLYIRCPFTLEEFLRQEQGEDERRYTSFRQQAKNTPHFFYTRDPGQPVIPGSSLRGMLRSLLEIVSYGKVQWVTEKQLFFRTVDNTAVGQYYRSRMTGKIEAGFLRRTARGYVIKVCQIARVHRDRLNGRLYIGQGPNQTPRWNGEPPHQWARVWVTLSNNGKFVKELSYTERSGWQEGVLVITGDVPRKKKEFVFLWPDVNSEEIHVPEKLLERFHDDDQITQWQERAFPKDEPDKNCRERNGMLRKNPPDPGDPVFFLREDGKLTFLGRAQMFRLPYVNSPLMLVPEELRRPEDIDYAEALFGFARTREELEDMKRRRVIQKIPKQGDKKRAYASRVFVTDAVLVEDQTDIWLSDRPVVPKILASPKPTAFQHYLVQPSSEKSELKHYDSKTPEETVIRGHKRYWLQGERTVEDIIETNEVSNNSTQHTQFKLIKPGVRFKFRIYFENLSKRELGAICWVLHPLGDPVKEYCHQLGMGKHLGMGAVKLEATLYLTDRNMRYSSLFDGDNWQTGISGSGQALSDRATLEQLTRDFEKHVLDVLNPNKPCTHLYELKRIAMLLKMMEWPGYPPVPDGPRFLVHENRPNTRYMRIQRENEYRHRPVLPDPSAFGCLTGDAEPTPSVTSSESSLNLEEGKEVILEPHASAEWRKQIEKWLQN